MTTKPFKHAPCDEQLNVSSRNPKPGDTVSCPKCGLTVSYEVFDREIKEYIADKVGKRMSGILRNATHAKKRMTFSQSIRPQKTYRFIADLE